MANSNKTTVVKASQTSGFARWQIMRAALAALDFWLCFIGTQINDKLFVSLREAESKVKTATLRVSRILFVDAGANGSTRFYAWNVKTDAKGDVYERTHKDEHGKMDVRGSINTLKAVFGANRVRFVSLKEVSALAQKQKMDKGCATDLGISLAVAKAVKAKGKGKAVVAA